MQRVQLNPSFSIQHHAARKCLLSFVCFEQQQPHYTMLDLDQSCLTDI